MRFPGDAPAGQCLSPPVTRLLLDVSKQPSAVGTAPRPESHSYLAKLAHIVNVIHCLKYQA